MSRVITFSRTFPATHPRKGEQTLFIEKLMNWFLISGQNKHFHFLDMLFDLNPTVPTNVLEFLDLSVDAKEIGVKRHTIRSGNRWKVGDKFSPRVWSGKPYSSKQIIIAPDIEIKKTWNIEIYPDYLDLVNGNPVLYFTIDNKTYRYGSNLTGELAKNDGLDLKDFRDWFNIHPKSKNKIFTGQIICWDESVNY